MKRVLAAIDFSRAADAVLREAARMARAQGATLEILHVAAPDPDFVGYGPGPDSVRQQRAETLHQERDRLRSMQEELEATGLEVVVGLVQGRTVESILARAREHGAGCIVVGSHGRSAMYKALVGSVTESILREAEVPVLVLPPRACQAAEEEER